MNESRTNPGPGRPGRRKGSGARAGSDASWGLRAVQALADPSRWRMIRALEAGPRPLGRLADAVDLSPACTSHHVSILKEAELVETKRQSRSLLCSLPREGSRAGDLLASVMSGSEHWPFVSKPMANEGRLAGEGGAEALSQPEANPKRKRKNQSNSILMEDFLF